MSDEDELAAIERRRAAISHERGFQHRRRDTLNGNRGLIGEEAGAIASDIVVLIDEYRAWLIREDQRLIERYNALLGDTWVTDEARTWAQERLA